jgi:predicted RNA-binding protein (TIGR00451 family)
VDEDIRANDEVIVVNTKDELLATGRAILSAFEMLEMERGVAVKVRQGVKK